MVDHYYDARSFEAHISNRFYFEEPPGAWQHLAECDQACWRCTWCRDNIVRKETPDAEPLRRISAGTIGSDGQNAGKPLLTPK